MRVLFLIAFLVIAFYTGFGQSITDLQKKKQDAAKEIEYTNKLLNDVQKDEKASLTRLRLLNSRLKQRNILIASINDEIKVYQEFIDNNNLVVEMLQDDLVKIKEEYARLIRFASRNKNLNDKVLFLLSADNMNQAYRRFLYMKEYTVHRKKQVETISAIQDLLQGKIEKLKQLQQTKQQLIADTRAETQKIASEKNQQDTEVQKLQKQKRTLRQKLNEQRQIERTLEQEIQRIIEEEARKNRDSGAPEFALTPEQKLMGDNFE
ncbi:MAG TPA: hypothetical protein VKA10_05710, partial [Prolixibacteraceae bacterium]|nr:hypothetical protein [Prolixibacteraceae bacterium]